MQPEWCCQNGTSSGPVDGVTWCTFGTVLCDEEPQRRTVGEIVFQRLDPFKIKGKVNSVGSFCHGTSFGRVTFACMSTAVTHRLDFLHVEVDGARWYTPRGALLKSATRRRRSSATVPSTTCTPIPRSLICFQTTRSATWAPTQYGSVWAVDCFEHAVALAAVAAMVATVVYGGVSIWMVSSSWLAALCKQLLCLKVIARYLGSGYGFKLGRQAAWRPGCAIGMVLSERHQQ